MAKDKKSFVAYADWKYIFEMLSDNEAGILVKHLLSYVNDENPTLEDRVLKMAFEPMKLQLKRDLRSWEQSVEEKSNGGRLGNLKRWNSDLYERVVKKEISLEEAEKIVKSRIASHSDKKIASVAVTVNDNVTVIDTVTDLSKSHYGEKSPSEITETKTANTLKNKEEKKEKNVAPKKEKAINHWKKIIDVWFEYYKSKFESEPTFDATQGKFLKSILSRFEKLAKKKDLDEEKEFDWSEDRAVRIFQKFLENAWIDSWLQQHFLLKNLTSNFDAIINKKPIENNGIRKQQTTNKKAARFSIATAAEQANASNS